MRESLYEPSPPSGMGNSLNRQGPVGEPEDRECVEYGWGLLCGVPFYTANVPMEPIKRVYSDRAHFEHFFR
jgi:hypothetical protein